MKDAYYFSHDSNAKDDFKITMVIEELGLEGYGIFWVLIETLREQTDYVYPMALLPSLARKYNTTVQKMKAVIERYNLFFIVNDRFGSHSLNRRMQLRDYSRVSGIKGNLIKYGHLTKKEANNMTSKEIIEYNLDLKTRPRVAPESPPESLKGKEGKEGKENKKKEREYDSPPVETTDKIYIEIRKILTKEIKSGDRYKYVPDGSDFERAIVDFSNYWNEQDGREIVPMPKSNKSRNWAYQNSKNGLISSFQKWAGYAKENAVLRVVAENKEKKFNECKKYVQDKLHRWKSPNDDLVDWNLKKILKEYSEEEFKLVIDWMKKPSGGNRSIVESPERFYNIFDKCLAWAKESLAV